MVRALWLAIVSSEAHSEWALNRNPCATRLLVVQCRLCGEAVVGDRFNPLSQLCVFCKEKCVL